MDWKTSFNPKDAGAWKDLYRTGMHRPKDVRIWHDTAMDEYHITNGAQAFTVGTSDVILPTSMKGSNPRGHSYRMFSMVTHDEGVEADYERVDRLLTYVKRNELEELACSGWEDTADDLPFMEHQTHCHVISGKDSLNAETWREGKHYRLKTEIADEANHRSLLVAADPSLWGSDVFPQSETQQIEQQEWLREQQRQNIQKVWSFKRESKRLAQRRQNEYDSGSGSGSSVPTSHSEAHPEQDSTERGEETDDPNETEDEAEATRASTGKVLRRSQRNLPRVRQGAGRGGEASGTNEQ